MKPIKLPEECRICGGDDWSVMYQGVVRAGRFGIWSANEHVVRRCGTCGVGYLAAAESDYESSAYRELVDGDSSPQAYYAAHDKDQVDNLRLVGTGNLRDKVIADIGCGAGSFLDLVTGYASQTIGIEPAQSYDQALRSKGHVRYSYVREALPEWKGKVDLASSFAVAEHVDDPVAFLAEIRDLLKPEGTLVLTTPNADDWLIEFLPGVYDRFFYRIVHRWYFNGRSLERLAAAAGFSKIELVYRQRFDVSNLLLWIRDGRPTGLRRLETLAELDETYRTILEKKGRSDFICARLHR